MIDFGEYSEIKEGEKENTQVTEIIQGKGKDFFTEEYFENFKEKDKVETTKNQNAIKVVMANGAEKIIMLPGDKKISPRSNLGLWKKTYGEYPKVGQNVTTRVDANGYRQVVLEK